MVFISLKIFKNHQPPMLMNRLPSAHLLHRASVYLNAVHFITPCTLYPEKQRFMGKIPLITYCIASRDTFQDKAVKTLDCRGEKKKNKKIGI